MHHSEWRIFTVYFDLLALRFNANCSSPASLDILFHHHIYIFTFVAVAVRKTSPFVQHSFCVALTRSWTTQKYLKTIVT